MGGRTQSSAITYLRQTLHARGACKRPGSFNSVSRSCFKHAPMFAGQGNLRLTLQCVACMPMASVHVCVRDFTHTHLQVQGALLITDNCVNIREIALLYTPVHAELYGDAYGSISTAQANKAFQGICSPVSSQHSQNQGCRPRCTAAAGYEVAVSALCAKLKLSSVHYAHPCDL